VPHSLINTKSTTTSRGNRQKILSEYQALHSKKLAGFFRGTSMLKEQQLPDKSDKMHTLSDEAGGIEPIFVSANRAQTH
jgi:hypothetical protein